MYMYVCRKNKVENKFKVKLQTNILKQATKTLLKSKTITAGCVNEAKGWLKGMRQMPELCAKYRKNWSGKFEFWSGKSQGKVREFCFTQIVDTLSDEQGGCQSKMATLFFASSPEPKGQLI